MVFVCIVTSKSVSKSVIPFNLESQYQTEVDCKIKVVDHNLNFGRIDLYFLLNVQ